MFFTNNINFLLHSMIGSLLGTCMYYLRPKRSCGNYAYKCKTAGKGIFLRSLLRYLYGKVGAKTIILEAQGGGGQWGLDPLRKEGGNGAKTDQVRLGVHCCLPIHTHFLPVVFLIASILCHDMCDALYFPLVSVLKHDCCDIALIITTICLPLLGYCVSSLSRFCHMVPVFHVCILPLLFNLLTV